MKPLCIELFAGKFGWGRGFVAEGYRCIGFDILHEDYHGDVPEGCELVLQDVLTLHGSQFRHADIIVASPPCQSYSYLAMPWSRSVDIVRPSGDGWEVLNSAAAKEMRAEWEHEGPDNRLFDACFRIQREACEATRRPCFLCRGGYIKFWPPCAQCGGVGSVTRFIPLVVENVKGAQPWVGRAAWSYGSFYLWGDVPALMPSTKSLKNSGGSWFAVAHNTDSGHSNNPVSIPAEGYKTTGMNWSDRSKRGQDFTRIAGQQAEGRKVPMNFHEYAKTGKPGRSFQSVAVSNQRDAVKQHGSGPEWFDIGIAKHSSGSVSRKAASAQIAMIPLELSSHIARTYKPAVPARLIA